jgi:septal ring factor EnvC (AmiA/AmiB activator)
MEDRDRDMLIRVEQQLANASQNQKTILEDLRDIFNRLERDSKMVTTISGDLKAHLESSVIRWSNLEKSLSELERRLEGIENKIDSNADSITVEREERTDAITSEREGRSKDNEERKNFEQSVKASVNTVSWILGALAGLATIISVAALFIKLG